MAKKQITKQFKTFGAKTDEAINEFMETEIESGRCFDIKIENIYPFEKAFIGGSEAWLMVVFNVKHHWAD